MPPKESWSGETRTARRFGICVAVGGEPGDQFPELEAVCG
ncbi:hypothetical protein [Alloactinosynnema sp. L-07]|nr:hypothetical protein [Alloactinosynnema sp. L-07]